jgi:hypothetical protein
MDFYSETIIVAWQHNVHARGSSTLRDIECWVNALNARSVYCERCSSSTGFSS